MFGFRSDGKKLKKVDPIIRLTSYIMPHRDDAQVFTQKGVRCENIDTFIREKFDEGIKISYMHVVIAGVVRMLAERPRLNRFIMSGRVYARNKIYISFAVKKTLSDNGEETTIKIGFTGHESIYDIKNMIDQEIAKSNVQKEETKTDKIANSLLKLPHFVLSPAVGFLKFLDKIGNLPKGILEASPFHTSCFVTNMKSIGMNTVLHHIYNFGTTGIFISMGKEKNEAVVNENGELAVDKLMELGIVIDERLCDGFYFGKSLKLGINYMNNPKLLEQRLETVQLDPDL